MFTNSFVIGICIVIWRNLIFSIIIVRRRGGGGFSKGRNRVKVYGRQKAEVLGPTLNTENAQTIALESGFYTLPEAARLLRRNRRMLGRWIRKEEGKDPVIITDFDRINKIYVISFLDLMELRFVSYFREKGVSLQAIRSAARILRNESGKRHPFIAMRNKFITDGRRIFLQAAAEVGDRKTIDIIYRQYVIFEIIEDSLLKGVEFDPKTSLPQKWHPDSDKFPNVFVSPYCAFGQPVVGGVPTAALMRSYRAEGTIEKVAEWYEIPHSAVDEAIKFEEELERESLH